MNTIFDTNIIIDYLKGIKEAKIELDKHNNVGISVITKIETICGIFDDKKEILIREFLNRFQIYPLTDEITDIAIALRREKSIKLPDAVIWATAIANNSILVTRNTKDFPEDSPDIRIPYKL